jgi:hypothetical protein
MARNISRCLETGLAGEAVAKDAIQQINEWLSRHNQ